MPCSCGRATLTFSTRRRPRRDRGTGHGGMEILRQCHERLDAIFVPVGGGGLIGGIAPYASSGCGRRPVVGVEPDDADAMERRSAGRAVSRSRTSACSPTASRCVRSARRRSGWRAATSTRWCWSTPTRSAPRSRTSSRTRAPSSSPPARSPSPARSAGSSGRRHGRTLVAIERRERELRPASASSPSAPSSASGARRCSRRRFRSGPAASASSAAASASGT